MSPSARQGAMCTPLDPLLRTLVVVVAPHRVRRRTSQRCCCARATSAAARCARAPLLSRGRAAPYRPPSDTPACPRPHAATQQLPNSSPHATSARRPAHPSQHTASGLARRSPRPPSARAAAQLCPTSPSTHPPTARPPAGLVPPHRWCPSPALKCIVYRGVQCSANQHVLLFNTCCPSIHCPQAGPAGAVSNYLAFGTGMDFMYTQLGVPYALTYEVYGSDEAGMLRGTSRAV